MSTAARNNWTIALYLSSQVSRSILLFASRFTARAVIPPRPHLTLGVYQGRPDQALPVIAGWALRLAPFALDFPAMAVPLAAPHNLLLLPVVTAELLAAHSELHGLLADQGIYPHAHYLPGKWLPHCTVAKQITDDSLGEVFKDAGSLKGSAICRAAAVLNYENFRELHAFPLGEGAGGGVEDRLKEENVWNR